MNKHLFYYRSKTLLDIKISFILGDGPSDNGSIYQLPRTNRLLSVEPIFCIPTSASANSVRSAYDPGSRPRGLSLEPNGILSTRFRSNSTPRYVLDVLWGQSIKLIQVVSTSEFHEY